MASAQQSAGQPPPDGRAYPDPPLAPSAHAEQRPAHDRLRRHPDRGLLGGVGAGVSEHLGVDVLLVRLRTGLGRVTVGV